jgi:phosphoglycerate kinase
MQDILNKKTLNDVDLKDMRVIVRADFNVPIKDGVVTDRKRIIAAMPTIEFLLENKCKIILLSHLSRIKSIADIESGKKSLKPVADVLQELFPEVEVKFLNVNRGQAVKDAADKLQGRQILVLENTRYNDIDAQGELVKLESKCNNALGEE